MITWGVIVLEFEDIAKFYVHCDIKNIIIKEQLSISLFIN